LSAGIPIEYIPLVSALIVGVANFVSILLAYYRMERRVEKKLDAYWKKFKNSKDGKAFLEIVQETEKLIKTSEVSALINEATGAFKELRSIMTKFAEKMETSQTPSEDEEEELLPRLAKKEEV
jgi:ferritin-like metal-binding protein YciE